MTISRSVKPPRCVRLLILGGHAQALQRVGLGARAVLPDDVDLEVAERVLGLEVEGLLAQTLRGTGVADHDVRAEALGAVAVLVVVADLRGGDQRVHRRAGRQHGARLAAGAALHAQARAEDLQAENHADAEDRERDRDLDERETKIPGGPCSTRGHPVASPTWTVPRRGSSSTFRRCSRRSRRLATTTSAPLVLPLGKKRICTTPSPNSCPPRTSSITARSVSTAQRPQAVVWMLFCTVSMTSSCGWPRATASPRQKCMVDAIWRAARRTSRASKPPSIMGTTSALPMAMMRSTTTISTSVKARRPLTRCCLPSW